MNRTAAARESVRRDAKTLLDTVGVSRVVIIDDEYAASVEELLGICSELSAAESERMPHLQGIHFDAPEELWAVEIREAWQKLDNAARRRVLAEARELDAGSAAVSADGETREEQAADDYKAASALEEILGGLAGLELVLLSLSEVEGARNRSSQGCEGGEHVTVFRSGL